MKIVGKDLGQVEKPELGPINKWHVMGSLWLLVGMIWYQGDLLNYGFGAIFLLPSAVLIGIGEKLRPFVALEERPNREHAEQQWEQSAAERTLFEIIAHEEGIEQDTHTEPHEYRCVGHPNRTLALRYGIANLDSDGSRAVPSDHIELRKVGKVSEDEDGVHYHAELPRFGNRIVRVVIRPGTDFILTFYPMSPNWFEEHAELEELLKDNETFTLKELAVFHVQEVLRAHDRHLTT